MRRFILSGLKFLLTVLVVYLALFYLLTRTRFRGKPLIYRSTDYYQWKGGVVHTKLAEWEADSSWDAVVIGSSHAYRGCDPWVFAERGYRMFNLGSTAQTPLSTYALLDAYVTRDRTPLVIFEIYANDVNKDGLESVSDLTQNLTSNTAALKLAASLRDVRALNMLTLRMMTRGAPPLYGDPDYKGRGFAIRADSAPDDQTYYIGRTFQLEPRQGTYFEKCLDLCDERGIRVVLSTHFAPHQSDRALHEAFVASIRSILAARDPAHPPVRWYDFAFDHDLSDHDHFNDHNHLNTAGARIFTDRLIDSLEADGYLRPHDTGG